MANYYEIRLSMEDFEGDGIPEILVQHWNGDEMDGMAYVTASDKYKGFDTVKSGADVNEDGVTNTQDITAILALAQAYAVMNLSIKPKDVPSENAPGEDIPSEEKDTDADTNKPDF
ncbi:hypothetical protein SAMN05444064_12430 [Pseudomonas syringae]|uniref:hypothetical protein n=1 Tax=Pseudomonas syringae TaxID=317 RepID=UPI00089C8916|nr:hypothetical protein [Pseudomonas syringae]SDX53333.1 hypothetical protein SAMN05444514_12530 [Pseudomonas syringae]SFM64521.1 hypothetical protein SAMN05444064_12430 [Pseudomonas syringae]